MNISKSIDRTYSSAVRQENENELIATYVAVNSRWSKS